MLEFFANFVFIAKSTNYIGIFNKLFEKSSSSVDSELKNACDSDNFDNIAKYINGDKAKYTKGLEYLSMQDNLSMKLRVMTLPVAEPEALMKSCSICFKTPMSVRNFV